MDIDHEPYNGVFEFGKVTPLYIYKNVSSSDVVVVVTDSSGGNLVIMSSSQVKVLSLGKPGSPSRTNIGGYDVKNCYRDGSLHFASYDPAIYYILEKENGRFSRMEFDSESLKESSVCNTVYLGQMCMSSESVTISKNCTDSPPPEIISGGSHLGAFYLFDSKNNIYYFPRYPTIGDGKPHPYMKVDKDEAWSPQPKNSTDFFPRKCSGIRFQQKTPNCFYCSLHQSNRRFRQLAYPRNSAHCGSSSWLRQWSHCLLCLHQEAFSENGCGSGRQKTREG